jgi:cytochrome c-type biogenesis protein CcsB
MKKILNIISSMKTMAILTLIFALSCAIATFIENDYGTETAWAVVYGDRWFEVLMALLWINLFINIFRYRLYKREKLGAFLFHVGFLVILIGAAITRYIGYEGMMHIREGKVENRITSSDSYIQLVAFKDGEYYKSERKILISKITPNDFTLKVDVDGKTAILTFKDYLQNVKREIVDDPNGKAMVEMMILEPNKRPKNTILKAGEAIEKAGVKIALDSDEEADFSIKSGEEFSFVSKKGVDWFKMSDKSSGSLEADSSHPFKKGQLYQIGEVKIVARTLKKAAKLKLVDKKDELKGGKRSNAMQKQAIIATLNFDGKTKELDLFGFGKGSVGEVAKTTVDGVEFSAVWGAKYIKLPFSIKLVDFILERYPGSMSPSSYESEVVLIDKEQNIQRPFRIYMNHILDHRGYRFFQSSYDMDEGGTILSVNHDPGKLPTYIGYLLMAIGFIITLFSKNSRFQKLSRAVKNSSLTAILVFVIFSLSSQSLQASQIDEAKRYDINHAEKFGDLLVQTVDGRIKPIDTFAHEVMMKLHKSTSVEGLQPSQVLLGMLTSPQTWQDIPIIRVKHKKIRKILSLKEGQKYASFNDFFKDKQEYKLMSYSNEAMQKRPIERNEFDRSIIKIDENLNILYMIYTGDLLKIIPKKGDPSKRWYSVKRAIGEFDKEQSNEVRELFINYFSSIDKAKKSGDWSEADKFLQDLIDYQYRLSGDIIPPKSKLKAEKIFKKLGITNKLILVYLFIGFILLALLMIKMTDPKKDLTKITKIFYALFIGAFIVHTLILIARWYIGGHAPWSNAYEAMLYVAWSMALSGVVFIKYSPMVPSLTAILAGSTLATTFFSQMNPQITNLVPVLKSYWLNIHVSVITASYGFLGLSMILGLFTLILFIINSPKKPHIQKSIIEATRLNEMTAIIGLMMLTLGNFLGGVWANESWGRYWGWDPKETWAWISILVYVVVTHLRFIPGFKKNYPYYYSVASIVAYSSIVMTFVGVNYYLSGMHSYAAGDPVPIPKYLYLIIAVLVSIILLAYPKRELKSGEVQPDP